MLQRTTLGLVLATFALVSACRGPGPSLKKPDLVVKDITVIDRLDNLPGGVSVVHLRIDIENRLPKNGIGQPTKGKFHIAVEISVPPSPNAPPDTVYLASPIGLGPIGVAMPGVPDPEITVKGQVKAGQVRMIKRQMWVAFVPGDQAQIQATVDWDDVIDERNENNNTMSVLYDL